MSWKKRWDYPLSETRINKKIFKAVNHVRVFQTN
jgi:hypothetical protein